MKKAKKITENRIRQIVWEEFFIKDKMDMELFDLGKDTVREKLSRREVNRRRREIIERYKK
jgi:hypothetical protein